MFLSDVFKFMSGANEDGAMPPELDAFRRELLKGSPLSPSEQLCNVLISAMLKQVTVWDRLVINIRAPGNLLGVLASVSVMERVHGDLANLQCPIVIKRRQVAHGVLEIEVAQIDLEEVWHVFPAPRALYFFVLDDVDDIRLALSLHNSRDDIAFSTVLLLKMGLDAVADLKTTIAAVPCRIVGWQDLPGANAKPEVVAIVATGEGVHEI